jgi:hypothetical protein
MFDNRIFPIFIFHVFDWLLTANLENAHATKNRHPHCLADLVLAGGGAFAFLHGSASKNSSSIMSASHPPSQTMRDQH